MKVITYTITLKEPVIVTGLEGDPNSSVSYNFLPGSVLRGALIGLYLRDQNLHRLSLKDGKQYRLFFESQFLNGYVMVQHEDDYMFTLPLPHSWHRPKYREDLKLSLFSKT